MPQRYRGPQDLRNIVGAEGQRQAIAAFETLWLSASPWAASAFSIPSSAISKPLDKHGRPAPNERGGYVVNPDIWLPDHNAVVECKASLQGRRFYAPKRQHEGYEWLSREAVWPVKTPIVYYAFVAFNHPNPIINEPLEAIRERLRPIFISIVSLAVVSKWCAQVGDYGKDWHAPDGTLLYENYYRLTVERVRKFTDAMESRAYGLNIIIETDRMDGCPIAFVHEDRPITAFEGQLPTATPSLFVKQLDNGKMSAEEATLDDLSFLDPDAPEPWLDLPF